MKSKLLKINKKINKNEIINSLKLKFYQEDYFKVNNMDFKECIDRVEQLENGHNIVFLKEDTVGRDRNSILIFDNEGSNIGEFSTRHQIFNPKFEKISENGKDFFLIKGNQTKTSNKEVIFGASYFNIDKSVYTTIFDGFYKPGFDSSNGPIFENIKFDGKYFIAKEYSGNGYNSSIYREPNLIFLKDDINHYDAAIYKKDGNKIKKFQSAHVDSRGGFYYENINNDHLTSVVNFEKWNEGEKFIKRKNGYFDNFSENNFSENEINEIKSKGNVKLNNELLKEFFNFNISNEDKIKVLLNLNNLDQFNYAISHAFREDDNYYGKQLKFKDIEPYFIDQKCSDNVFYEIVSFLKKGAKVEDINLVLDFTNDSKYDFEHILSALCYSDIDRTEDIKMLIKNKEYFSKLDMYKIDHYLLNNIVEAITYGMKKTKIKGEIFKLFIDKKVSREGIYEIINEIENTNLEDNIENVTEYINDKNLKNTAK